jgi:hypothetical protein
MSWGFGLKRLTKIITPPGYITRILLTLRNYVRTGIQNCERKELDQRFPTPDSFDDSLQHRFTSRSFPYKIWASALSST